CSNVYFAFLPIIKPPKSRAVHFVYLYCLPLGDRIKAALTGSYQAAIEAVMLNKTIPNYNIVRKFLMSFMKQINNTGHY
ncbi:hypothetical protein, partial [Sharpea azabuensis]|uniref:hypothetical protein n=1 Tax=Sharpea azabuensis TaxID=322505 RepID=UPI0023F0196D